MKYSFDIQHAQRFGVNEAIFIQNILFWITTNKQNGTHNHDGRTWTYNSAAAFAKLFPFWKPRKIDRIIGSLVKQGVLIIGNYNRHRYDKTRWISFVNEKEFFQENTDKDFEGTIIQNPSTPENDESINGKVRKENPKSDASFTNVGETIPDLVHSQNRFKPAPADTAVNYLRSTWKRALYPLEEKTINELVKKYDLDQIIYAIDQSVIYNACKIIYIKAILSKSNNGTTRGSNSEQAIQKYLDKLKGGE